MLTWNRLDRTDVDFLALQQPTEAAQFSLDNRPNEPYAIDDFEELLPSGD